MPTLASTYRLDHKAPISEVIELRNRNSEITWQWLSTRQWLKWKRKGRYTLQIHICKSWLCCVDIFSNSPHEIWIKDTSTKHRVKVFSLHIICLVLVELIKGRIHKWLNRQAKCYGEYFYNGSISTLLWNYRNFVTSTFLVFENLAKLEINTRLDSDSILTLFLILASRCVYCTTGSRAKISL